MKRTIGFFVSFCLLVAIVVFCFIGILIYDYKNTNEEYNNIEIGDSKNSIEKLFGQPDYIEFTDTLYHTYNSPYNKYIFIYKDNQLIRKWKER